MEYLFWDVYDAVLFTPSGNYSAGTHPIKFKLTYLRDFEAKKIVKATNEQWEHIGKKSQQTNTTVNYCLFGLILDKVIR